MPEFLHELRDARDLFEAVAAERAILPLIVEKDYWVTHCLWGLQQGGFDFEMKGGTSLSKGWKCIDRFSEDIDLRIEPPSTLNLRGEKPAQIEARFAFYDELAETIDIPGILVRRNRAYDDEKARNAGIALVFQSHCEALPGLNPEVLLEVGFARTAPNEPRDFTSWAYEAALRARVDVVDNRAAAVKCFNPELTFVDKLQTICKRFRQHRDRNEERDRPRQFLRHYYDVYKLLELERVRSFIGTADYDAYKREKIRGADASEFASGEAFTIQDDERYRTFQKEFESLDSLLFSPGPSFEDVIERLRSVSRAL